MGLFMSPRILSREAKYEKPIASRELILALIENGRPMSRDGSKRLWCLQDEDEVEGLRRRLLRAMEQDGATCLYPQWHAITG